MRTTPPMLPLRPPLLAALAGSALLLLLQAMPTVAPFLEYRRSALSAEPWRLLTGHFVHVNWMHALANAGAWILLSYLFAPRLSAARQLLALALGAAAVSLALAAGYPAIAWYRGASGALHALFFAGATVALARSARRRPRSMALLPLALVVAGWIKVAVDLPRGGVTAYADWLGVSTVPQAHLIGAIAGTALGVYFAARSR